MLARLVLLLFVLMLPRVGLADDSGAVGDSGREARAAATRRLPLKELEKKMAREVASVVKRASLFRSLPTRVVDCDERLFAMMIDRPDVLVDIWRVLGVSKLRLERLGEDRYAMTDATGASGDVRVLHSDRLPNGQHRVLARAVGVYHAPPMPRAVKATTVMLFTWRPYKEANGRTYVRAELDAFVHVDRPAAQLIARAVQPIAVKTADHNFVETLRFISMFSLTAQRNPDGVAGLAKELSNVDPPTRERLATVCYDLSRRQIRRGLQQASLRQAQAVATDAPRGARGDHSQVGSTELSRSELVVR